MLARVLDLGTKLFLLLLLCPALAAAEDAPQLLEVWVNGQTRHVVAAVTLPQGDVLMQPDDLCAAGLTLRGDEIPGSGGIAVNRLAGVKAQVEAGEQKLMLTVADDRLTPQRIDLKADADAAHAASDTGFLGSYDFVGTTNDFDHAGRSSTAGATLGGTLFTPQGLLNGNGFTQTDNRHGFTRLDTVAEYDDPAAMRRWAVGDGITGSLSWTRAVRFGGFQLASDFSMRPDLNTMPLPAFFGQTAVPATVDVYVNAARVFEGNVDSGPFQINDLPIITGNGQVTVVTRDVLGQQTTSVLPFYASSQMLKQGLESYAFDVGVLRQAYGQQSFAYGRPATTGTYSTGVTDWLTAETHAEATPDIQMAGGGASFALGTLGVLHAAAAASTRRDDDGRRREGSLYNLSIESQPHPFGFFASVSKSLGDYADIATQGGTAPPTFQTQTGASVGLDTYGSLALSFITAKSDSAPASQFVSASYTLSLGSHINFGLTSFYDVTQRASVSEALVTFALDGQTTGHASASRSATGMQEEAGVIRPASLDGGVGYRALATDGQNQTAQGDLNWINARGNFDAALSSRNGMQAGQFTAAGGVVVMDGSAYATQVPNGAVALVRTGQADAHVFHENRDLGTTDADGEMLLTNFAPYTANHISIDPREYDIADAIDAPQKTVVPRRQSGVIVDMTPVRHAPVLLVLRQEDGQFPPMGAKVTMDNGSAPTVVGRHGEVYIADLPKPAKALVEFAGGSCHFDLTPPAFDKNNPIPRLDPVACAAGPA